MSDDDVITLNLPADQLKIFAEDCLEAARAPTEGFKVGLIDYGGQSGANLALHVLPASAGRYRFQLRAEAGTR